jgi:lipoprotein NlpI
MVRRNVPYADAYALLGDIYLGQGKVEQAATVYRAAIGNQNLNQLEREGFQTFLRRLGQGL